ncbi:MAG: hypothetical protein ACK5LS_07635 [Propioniciclava sp.]
MDRRGRPSPTRHQQILAIQRAYLAAMRDELRSEQTIGAYSSTVLHRAQSLIDAQERGISR